MHANIFQHIVAKWAILRSKSKKDAWERAIFQENWPVFNSLYATKTSAKDVGGWDLFRAYDATPQALHMLLGRGANPHVKHTNGQFEHLIQRAAGRGDIETVSLILKAGGDLKARCFNEYDTLGWSVIQWGEHNIGIQQRRDMVRFLLDHGADATSLQGFSKYSLLYNDHTDLEICTMLVEAGAPLQWDMSHHDNSGQLITQTCHLFHRIFQKSSRELCITDLEHWMQLLQKHGALDDPTPDWNNGYPLSHAILSSNLNPEHYLCAIGKHLGSLDQLSATGENVWHTLLSQAPYKIQQYKDILWDRNNTRSLLTQPNNQGVLPRDILQHAMKQPDVTPKAFEMLEEMDRDLFQRTVLLDAVCIETAPTRHKRLKL